MGLDVFLVANDRRWNVIQGEYTRRTDLNGTLGVIQVSTSIVTSMPIGNLQYNYPII